MNGHEPVNKFISYLGEDGTRAHQYWNFSGAWCCGEVAMVMKQTTGNLFYDGKKVVYCPTAYSWCKTHLQKIPTRNAQFGDIIFFDWNRNGVPDHIGMVEYVSGSTVHTLEGNTGSPARVRRKTRASYILGIFRPKYEPPKPEDYIVKVDGEWGYHTCLATQYVLGGLDLDGVLGKATIKAIQKKVGTTVNDAWDKNTSIAMSKFLGIAEQTTRSEALITAWQKWLNKEINAKIDPPTPTPPTPTPGGIEGHPTTYRPTKPYTGTVPSKSAKYGTTDNVPVMTFLNWCLGINLGKDGIFGVKSRQAIYDYQATYGLEQDGIFGPQCIAKAKEIINAHKKGVHKMGHCASRALDCVEANFTYSSSTSSPYHWTYVAVWKDEAQAEKCAEFAEQCNKRTPRIQYDDKPNLKSKVIANKGNMPSGSLTGNCSNYVNACVYHASKVNVLDYGAKNNRKYLEASGLFNIYEGDQVKGYIQRGAIYGGSHHTAISLGLK